VTFAEQLRRILDERDLHYADLAAAAGLSRATVYELTRRDKVPSLSSFVALARALDVMPGAFAYCDDVAPPADLKPAGTEPPPGWRPGGTTFGERLAARIDARGLTKFAAADAAGFDYTTLVAYLNNKYLPAVPTAAKLACVLGVTLNALLDGCADLDPAGQVADATA
jgi:transcriptional regulator with XRE-family HTH domain